MSLFCSTRLGLKRTLDIAANTFFTRHAPFTPSLACMATRTSSPRAIQSFSYLVLPLDMPSKCITGLDIAKLELKLHEDEHWREGTFV